MSMRISKVYTRTGDAGTTRLIGGETVSKAAARIDSYGTVDELQAVLGMLRASLRESAEHRDEAERLDAVLDEVQNDLFDLGSVLSTPPDEVERSPASVSPERIAFLEESMDAWLAEQEPLRSFILSGGGRYSAVAHLARTVCRRAERCVVRLGEEEPVPAEVAGYLNRLSDWLFVLARHLARVFGEEEPLWRTPLRDEGDAGGDEDGEG